MVLCSLNKLTLVVTINPHMSWWFKYSTIYFCHMKSKMNVSNQWLALFQVVFQGPRHLPSCGSPTFNTELPKMLCLPLPSHWKEVKQRKLIVGIFYAPGRNCYLSFLLIRHQLELSQMIRPHQESLESRVSLYSECLRNGAGDLLASLFFTSVPCLLHSDLKF